MAAPSLLMFDLDGTLVDTEGVAVEATREGLASFGVTMTPAEESWVVGVRWEEVAERLVAAHQLPIDAVAFETLLHDRYRQKTLAGVLPVRGSAEMVRALQRRFRLFVVSGSPRDDIEYALDSLRIADCIERIVGAEDYSRGKPSPEPYREALRAAAANGPDALVFEDSEVGIQSAMGAGLPVVAVTGAHRIPQNTARARWRIVDFVGVDEAWIEARWAERDR